MGSYEIRETKEILENAKQDTTPHALTREQVENHISVVIGGVHAERVRAAEGVLAHDAAQRLTIEQQAQELQRHNRLLQVLHFIVEHDGEFDDAEQVRVDVETYGLGDVLKQQAQKINRLRAQVGRLEVANKYFAISEEELAGKLAAMTAERDTQGRYACEMLTECKRAQMAEQQALKHLTASEQEAGRLRGALDLAMGELKNIINVNIKEWDDPTDTAFKLWAQSRSRFTLGQAQRALKEDA